MADRILEGKRALVACRWCGELHDHMLQGAAEHKCDENSEGFKKEKAARAEARRRAQSGWKSPGVTK